METASSLPPEKNKLFDKARIHCGIGNPVYDNCLTGTPAIKVMHGNQKSANISLSPLGGLRECSKQILQKEHQTPLIF